MDNIVDTSAGMAATLPHKQFIRTCALITLVAALGACAVGPDYVRPVTVSAEVMSAGFRESWKPAEPQDTAIPVSWWLIYKDPGLNTLIEQVAGSNLTLAQAEASYRQSTALLDNAQSAYLPTLTANVAHSRAHTASNNNSANSTGNNTITSTKTLTVGTSWEVDLGGGIRREIEVVQNTALSGYANLQATRLSMQAQLAQNYFQLRVLDAQIELYNRTVADYQRALTMTQNQYAVGLVASDSVILAETQLRSTEAQALDLGILRAQLEHAIAILIGKAPSNFSIRPLSLTHESALPQLPEIPNGLPSSLLERRPDIASSERLVAAANAQIGVTKAAFFPTLSLNASGGYQSTMGSWLSLPNRIWSVGPSLAVSLFDGGAHRALNAQAIAAYDGTVASYRQTVLTGFQQVEDNLVALRILQNEATVQRQAVIASRKAVDITLNKYKAGIVDYQNVITAQTTALTNERSELDIINRRLAASVLLVKALGGGWDGHMTTDK